MNGSQVRRRGFLKAMTFQDLDRAYAAHLEDGSIICYLAEVVLAEIKGVQLTRARNEYGISLLERKE